MDPDKATTQLEDAISFGHATPPEEAEELETTDTRSEGDRDPNAQGISNRPGDMEPDQGIDPEPGNNA